TCTRTSPGVAKAECTTQRGQEPPKRAKGKPAAEKRFETLPAGSTRRKKNGTPRAPGCCMDDSRWHACSKDTPKRAATAELGAAALSTASTASRVSSRASWNAI